MRNGRAVTEVHKRRASVRNPQIDTFAETSSERPYRIAQHPKNSRESETHQALTRCERAVYCYLRNQPGNELVQSIRRYSAALKIPREEVKKALQGLADKGRISLRTVRDKDSSAKLRVTIKEVIDEGQEVR